MLQVLLSAIIYAHRFATPENRWRALFFDALPTRLMVTDPEALRGMWNGGASLYRVHTLRALGKRSDLDDAREPVCHHAEQPGNAGQQEHRRDRKLDHMRDIAGGQGERHGGRYDTLSRCSTR